MGMGFQFEQHRLGLWDLKKTISWEMGLGLPLHDPLRTLHDTARQLTRKNSRACAVILPLCRSAHELVIPHALLPLPGDAPPQNPI